MDQNHEQVYTNNTLQPVLIIDIAILCMCCEVKFGKY